MSEPQVTEEDREKAIELLSWCQGESEADAIAEIAHELAVELEKARAPFLALAEEYDRHAGLMQAEVDSGGPLNVVMRSQAFRDAAETIRRAAEDPT